MTNRSRTFCAGSDSRTITCGDYTSFSWIREELSAQELIAGTMGDSTAYPEGYSYSQFCWHYQHVAATKRKHDHAHEPGTRLY